MELEFPVMPACLTKAEEKIMDYIFGHTGHFLFASIGQLSEQLGISDATISRFARHVGCKDFKELKAVVMEQSTIGEPAIKMAGTLNKEKNFCVESWIMQQQICLKHTMEQLDSVEFQRAAEEIVTARRIFIHGKNASGSMAQLLFYRLRRLGIQVSLLPAGGTEIIEGLVHADNNDLVVMFSFSKISNEGRLILDYQKSAGYHTLAFTSRLYVPKEQMANVNLYVYRGEEKEYHSMSAPAAIVDALTLVVSEKIGAKSVDKLREIHVLKRQYTNI
ncbi:MurR/RpiR family transcriptional regulator [Anaerosacchariphilus polymeriproducens]|uniref:MurR/RpiR family transcriptional regulator n=1 Tax=Anaerosacchariphilus polymeriproducens TaxID=1812858 RepID=A0A371AZG8_9FIRM|nr:MurR/RpiR family transcriptional regulator [Anaerosacchariphilus polymeriproducens]RDU24947.1 MurR/RpiR family transcriptional regulator [Anaerosacchariphilus polymeriproducens]